MKHFKYNLSRFPSDCRHLKHTYKSGEVGMYGYLSHNGVLSGNFIGCYLVHSKSKLDYLGMLPGCVTFLYCQENQKVGSKSKS